MAIYILLYTAVTAITTTVAWSPKSQVELKGAIAECLKGGDCSKGPHGPIGSWDVSAMTDTSKLFLDESWNYLPGADKFNGRISKWEVSSVTTMRHMFQGATSFNGDLSKWDVSSVKDMYQMFCKVSKFNGDLSKWDVSSVANMQSMFYEATAFSGDISKWDVSNVNTMSSMFAFAKSFNGDVSKWDVSKVTNVNTMFQSAESFNGDISSWDVSSVTIMRWMFSGASSFAQTLCGAWLTSTANKKGMFDGSSGKMCTTTRTAATTTTTRTTTTTGWAPKSQAEMKAAIGECLQLSPDCSKGPHGPIGLWDVSAVTEIYIHAEDDKIPGMSKFNGDISKWDVSSVTNMHSMFWGATSFNSDISNWDVSSVVSMYGMFMDAAVFNDDISKWDVSSVKQTAHMFFNAAAFNSDLSKWDVSSVTSMFAMFEKAPSFNGDISKWDVSRVTNMRSMFNKASSFNGDLSKWDVSSVTHMYQMFFGASSFAQTLCGAWLASTADKDGMFDRSSGKICTTARTAATTTTTRTTTVAWAPRSRAELQAAIVECLKLSSDCSKGPHGQIGTWVVSAVTDMSFLFNTDSVPAAKTFNGDISKWDVSGVDNMFKMFYGAELFNGDISEWDVSSVPVTYGMFMGAKSFNRDISKWDVSSVDNMNTMFSGATSFKGDISKWDVSSVTDMFRMFFFAKSFNRDISKWDVSSVTDMHQMFSYATSFNGDLSKWDVSSVTDMRWMFDGASSFTQTLCEKWRASKARKDRMFQRSSGKMCSITTTVTTTTTSMTTPSTTTTTTTTPPSTTTTTTPPSTTTTTTPPSTTPSTGPPSTTATSAPPSTTATSARMKESSMVVVIVCATIVVLAVMLVPLLVIKQRSGSNMQSDIVPQTGPKTPDANMFIANVFMDDNAYALPMNEDNVKIEQTGSNDKCTMFKNDSLGVTTTVPLKKEWTFGTSNYKRFYTAAEAPVFQHELLSAVHNLLKIYATRINPTIDPKTVSVGVKGFMAKIQDDAFQHKYCKEALQNDVASVAEYLWTSGKEHDIVKRAELCSVLNAVIRDDIAEEIAVAATIFRSINIRRINRPQKKGVQVDVQTYPPKGETWRGGGFREQCTEFFKSVKGKKYRVPGFLATSSNKMVADQFAFKADKNHPCAIWRIKFDKRGKKKPQYRVQHMTFVQKTLIPGEHEYLFAPYSVFTLTSVKWSDKRSEPHEFTIQSVLDNKVEDENLPLAPWY